MGRRDRVRRKAKPYHTMVIRCKPLRKHFNGWRVPAIDTPAIQDYAEKRLKAVSTPTVDRELAQIKAILRHGKNNNKVHKVPYIPLFNVKNPKDDFLSYDQFHKLDEHLPIHLSLFARFLFATGWRAGEAQDLTWDRVNLEEQTIKLRPEKVKEGKFRSIYMTDDILEVLKKCYKRKLRLRNFSDYVFVSATGRSRLQFNQGYNRGEWCVACRKAGLGYGYAIGGDNAKYEIRLNPGPTLHTIRRSYIRLNERAGVPRAVTMSYTGHRTESTYSWYNIVREEDQKIAEEMRKAYLEKLNNKRR